MGSPSTAPSKAVSPCEPIFYVYLWTNLKTGKQYVGKGNKGRAWAHFRPKAQGAFAHAVRKHTREAFRLEVLVSGLTEEQAFAAEQEAVFRFGTLAPNGYNLQRGGSGRARSRRSGVSEETRQKLRDAHRGQTPSEATRKKLSEAYARRLARDGVPSHMPRLQAAGVAATVAKWAHRKPLYEKAVQRVHAGEQRTRVCSEMGLSRRGLYKYLKEVSYGFPSD
jgi:hypothetical protein